MVSTRSLSRYSTFSGQDLKDGGYASNQDQNMSITIFKLLSSMLIVKNYSIYSTTGVSFTLQIKDTF